MIKASPFCYRCGKFRWESERLCRILAEDITPSLHHRDYATVADILAHGCLLDCPPRACQHLDELLGGRLMLDALHPFQGLLPLLSRQRGQHGLEEVYYISLGKVSRAMHNTVLQGGGGAPKVGMWCTNEGRRRPCLCSKEGGSTIVVFRAPVQPPFKPHPCWQVVPSHRCGLHLLAHSSSAVQNSATTMTAPPPPLQR